MFKNLFGRKEKPLTRELFAEMVAEAFRDAGTAVLRTDRDSFSLVDERQNRTYLQNLFTRVEGMPAEQRAAEIERFVRGQVAKPPSPESYEEARAQLMPVLRSEDYASLVSLVAEADGNAMKAPVSRAVAPGIVVMLALDSELTITMVGPQNLATWGVDFDVALKDAMANLRRTTDFAKLDWDAKGVLRGAWADSYETSRFLLPELFEGLRVEGDPVVFVPAREQMWICGSEETEQVASLIAESETVHFGSYPLSDQPMVLREGAWRGFVPEDAAQAQTLRGMHYRRTALDYAQQKDCLERIHKRTGEDVFVASYSVYQKNEDGAPYSRAVWSKDVVTLLPVVDRVMLFVDQETKDAFVVTWDDLVAVAGDRVERDKGREKGLRPVRYRVEHWPSDEQIAELRQRSRSF